MLYTERLVLREFRLSDADFIFRLMNSPLYIKYIGDRNIHSFADAKNYLNDKIIASYHQHGYGLYAVLLKDTEQVIGMSGLVRRENLPHADIGFGFLSEFMGHGYAYEASKAVMDYAQQALNLSPILAITVEDNKRSIKLLEKLGLKRQGIIEWEQEPLLLLST